MQNKPIAEHLPQVRVSDLKQQGLLSDEYWQDDYYAGSNEPFRMFGKVSNEFRYTLKVFGNRTYSEISWLIGEARYRAIVKLVNDKVNFGGYRFWFVCPNCSRRCGILYIIQNVCGCNKCLSIAYASQNKTKGKPPTIEEMDEQSQRLTNIWLSLWQRGRFFFDNQPTKEYQTYLLLARDLWGAKFTNPESVNILCQSHDPLLFKPPHVAIGGR